MVDDGEGEPTRGRRDRRAAATLGRRGSNAAVGTPWWHFVALAVAALSLYLGPASDVAAKFAHVDWDGYQRIALSWLQTGHLYADEQLRGPYHPYELVVPAFSYPPPAILLFVAFVPLGYLGWAAANVLVLASGLAAVCSHEVPRYRILALAAMLAVTSVSRPYIEGVAVGNVNVGLAGLFAWAWALGRGTRSASVVAAFAGLVKPFLGALVFWSDRRSVVVSMLGALLLAGAIAVITLPLVGFGAWVEYMVVGRNTLPLCSVSLRPLMCGVEPITGPATSFVIIAYGVIVSGLAVFARSDILAYGLIVAAMFGIQFELFSHSFLYAMVLLFAAAARLTARVAAGRAAWTSPVAAAD